MKVSTLILKFECNREVKQKPDLLRGYLGRKFKEYVLMHQHMVNGKFVYRYPMVQYKMWNGIPVVMGIAIGAQVLKEIHNEVNVLELNSEKYEIFGKDIFADTIEFGSNKEFIGYSFLTPWLALNEENYKKYGKLGTRKEKKELLARILIGNIISMSKGLGYTVPEPIKVNIGDLREVKTSLKRTPMLGFLGSFSVNFEVPDYFGLGKSVSRGFGTIKRIDSKLKPCQDSRRLNNNPAKIEASGRQG